MLSDEDFGRLLQQLDRPWAGYRKVRKGVKKRVRRHMEQVGCRSIENYLQLMKSQPDVKRACEKGLYVTISRFFRDRKFWQDLESRLFPIMIRDFAEPLRIWSAGCACGEEPYSIAMVFSLIASPPELTIIATDAQQDCLERARKGRFGQSSLKELPNSIRSGFFSSRKSGRQFSVNLEKLPSIQWRHHDMLHESPPSCPFHMIFLRNNLLTYHQGPELQSAFSRIISVKKINPDDKSGAPHRMKCRSYSFHYIVLSDDRISDSHFREYIPERPLMGYRSYRIFVLTRTQLQNKKTG